MTASHHKEHLLPTLLLVNDTGAHSDALARVLHAELPGCRVLSTASPEKALVLAAGGRVDCAVIDLNMREMSGIELCRHLQLVERPLPLPLYTQELEQIGAQCCISRFLANPGSEFIQINCKGAGVPKIRVVAHGATSWFGRTKTGFFEPDSHVTDKSMATNRPPETSRRLGVLCLRDAG